ncbi:MAG: acyl carrier protein, partial [Gallionella sp.]
MDTQLEIKYPSAVTASLHHASSDISYQEQIREFFIMNTAADIENTGFEQELAQHIITALNMDMNPAEIDPLAPLHGDDGLGIDSIDVL